MTPRSPTDVRLVSRLRRRTWVILAALVAVMLALTALVATQGRSATADNIAGQAAISASSTSLGSSPVALADGNGSTEGRGLGREWSSNQQTDGASATLTWKSPRTLGRISIEQSTDIHHRVSAGFLSFSDGSSLAVNFDDGAEADLSISPRDVQWMKFTVSVVPEGAKAVGLAEIRIFGASATIQDSRGAGNVASAARASAGGHPAPALVDGDNASGLGDAWTSPDRPSVTLTWPASRELTSVQFFGDSRAETTIESGSLQFSDGSAIRVGEVLRGEAHPTTIAFMPRLASRITFTPDDGATGLIGLAEVRAYTVGSTPFRELGDAAPRATFPASCPTAPGDEPQRGQITIRCPTPTSEVNGLTEVTLYAPGMARVEARIWSPGLESTETVSARTSGSDAEAAFTFDAGVAENGPITLRIQGFESKDASAAPSASAVTYLQLYNKGGRNVSTSDAPKTSEGMTLAYSEEFTRALSVSRSGEGAEYSASKPEHGGPAGFGEADFADPESNRGNLTVVGDDYLRISTSRAPRGGGDHQYIGGILASARPGGSGFSAQFGYFESRMLAPVGKGTWPAFWTLPSPNLIEDDKTGAEFDVVELYGHDPVGACVATHEYFGGGENKNILCDPRFGSVKEAMEWHTYGARITPTEVIFYIDGREIERAPQVTAGDRPMFFLANLALGGGWPIELDAVDGRTSLYVDYIRVYT